MKETIFRDDLDWLAFQYVAGEMSAVEADEFERRLAYDQAARDAVAWIVELTQATAQVTAQAWDKLPMDAGAAARVERRKHSSRRWLRQPTWVSWCVAVGLLAALLVVNAWRSPATSDREEPGPVAGGVDERELALAWVRTRLNLQPDVEWGELVKGDDRVADLALAAVDTDSDIEMPSWMLSAVAGVARDGGNLPVVE
jgi:hypothetical protein